MYDQYNIAQECLTLMLLKSIAMDAKNECIYMVQGVKLSEKLDSN